MLNFKKLFPLENVFLWFYDALPYVKYVVFSLNMFLTGMLIILSKIRRNYLLWPPLHTVDIWLEEKKEVNYQRWHFLILLLSIYFIFSILKGRKNKRETTAASEEENAGKYTPIKRWSDIDWFVGQLLWQMKI